jgi:penicillin-binding protein 2
MYLEPVRKQRAPGDDPSIALRLALIVAVAIMLFSVLGFRLWFLQILSGDRYTAMANNNRLRTVSIEAPRGVVYDRNGKTLVQNRAGLSVGILPMDLRNEDIVLPRVATLLGMPEAEIRAKLKTAMNDKYRVIILKEDVPENTVVAFLKEHSLEFPGVRVETSYQRDYGAADRAVRATHILGYVGEISDKELLQEWAKNLKAGDRVGKMGVELQYDAYLRGKDGTRTVEVDATGRPKQQLQDVAPLPGKNLVLTIDSELQAAAEKAIREGIDSARKQGFKNAAAGVVVAINPKNGQILAMTSFPDYDPSLWVGGMKQSDFDRLNSAAANQPLFNRAIAGEYAPGSTFKPFIAATALNKGLINGTRVFNDPGYLKVGGQTFFCWNRQGHGEVNLLEALMESCDVYFYNVGQLLYNQNGPVLQDGVRQFGFGDPTGVDLPGESKGQVPDSKWKKEAVVAYPNPVDRIWKTGDEVNLAIGQGDMLSTPLQLATAFAAIANADAGKTDSAGNVQLNVLVPHVGLQITDAAGNIVHEFETQTRKTVSMTAHDLGLIRTGLQYVTSDTQGTAYGAFKGFPVPVVGKTGTSQKAGASDYAWFMGYAPANDPKILVVALVEQGGHGSSVAAPVVRRVMEQYFGIKSGSTNVVQWTE